jgi:hypothetical protein
VAKNEREMLREWASVVSEVRPGGTGGPAEPKDYRPMDLGGGSGQFGGAGGKIEPTLSVPKPRIKIEPGETMPQAIQRAQQQAQQSAKPSGRVEPKLHDEPTPTAPAAAKDPDAINFKKDVYNAAKSVVGDTYKGIKNVGKTKPVLGTLGIGAAGVLGYGALRALQKPGETVKDTAHRLGQDIGGTGMNAATGVVQGAGDELSKAEREAGVDTPPPGNTAFDQAVQDLTRPDGRLGPIKDGSGGLQETRVFTRHPVTGAIVQLNVNNISRVVNQPFYESYECGAGESSQWQCQVWSSTPVSKLLKGRS